MSGLYELFYNTLAYLTLIIALKLSNTVFVKVQEMHVIIQRKHFLLEFSPRT